MNINQLIIQAVSPVVSTVVPDYYEGTNTTYCTFVANEIPNTYGDNEAVTIRYMVTLNLFMPRKTNPFTTKRAICSALQNYGFTYPSVTNLSDADGQYFVFECQYEGWANGGT